jgi:KDO2-lipid IV(A) lauroyltransferase
MRAFIVKFLIRFWSLLPLRLAHACGAILAHIVIWFPNKPMNICRKNVRLCYPELSAAQQQALVKRIFVETGKTVTEIGALWLWPKDRLLKLVKKISGEEALLKAVEQKRGVIIAAPHIGAWEMVGLYWASRFPMTSLYRPPKMSEFDQFVRSARERCGARLVPTNTQGVKALLHAIKKNELIGILPDQDPGDEGGVFAPFFGIETNTMTLLPRLARKSGAAVFLVFAQRLPKGQGFHMHVIPAPEDIASADLLTAATALNQGVERCIRLCPTQYQWIYKRFKKRPAGEPGFYG